MFVKFMIKQQTSEIQENMLKKNEFLRQMVWRKASGVENETVEVQYQCVFDI